MSQIISFEKMLKFLMRFCFGVPTKLAISRQHVLEINVKTN